MNSTRCNAAQHPSARRRTPLIRLISLAFSARRSRRALGQLDESALRDIGMTKHEAETEASRPIWDVPRNWRE